MRRQLALLLLAGLLVVLPGCGRPKVVVGSKDFNESTILGEVVAQYVGTIDPSVEHRSRLGGSAVLWNALKSGEIDVYPDYTGTLREELLSDLGLRTDDELRVALEEQGLRMTESLGFENSYEIGIADKLHADAEPRFGTSDIENVRRISDLRAFPKLKGRFGNEFMERSDGWRALKQRYALPQEDVVGLEHDFAYRGLANGSIDMTDIYSTDANVKKYDVRVLEDDLDFFPEYRAVLVYRADLETRAPRVVEAIRRLEGLIDVDTMTAMNARTMLDHEPASLVASDFLNETFGLDLHPKVPGLFERLWKHTTEHLLLVVTSLLAAIVVAVPLGIVSAKQKNVGQFVLGTVGTMQTIPSLALFVVLIPLLGLGAPPAIFALFLYSLLPIVRNTHAGLVDIPAGIHESAEAIGLPRWERLRLIELPMAARSILAGIKTAAVINVGTATLGGFIGAGGYGDPIFSGIRQQRTSLMLEGAIPAALMALAAQGLFELAELRFVPKGLRLKPTD